MSDGFIPLNQSTPVRGKWHNRNQNRHHHNNRYHHNNQPMGHNYQNRWGNNSKRNSSYGSDSTNSSFGQDNKSGIDAYLHPSMLEDPWAQLRQTNNRSFNE